MMMRTIARVLVVLFLSVMIAEAQPVKLPVYGVRRAVDAIRVDGKLDEMSWALAPRLGEFRQIRTPDTRPHFPTEGALVWDDVNLYVSFACNDLDPWGRLKNRDDRLWDEEVVEVFLDPDGDGLNYAELEVSPHNVVVDLLIAKPRGDTDAALKWNIDGLQTAVTRHAAGWVTEIAIPWKSLAAAGASAAPKPGEQWRAGFYRIKRPGGVAKADEIAALVAERKQADETRGAAIDARLRELRSNDEYSAWSITRPERGFHDPERFGYIEFLGGRPE